MDSNRAEIASLFAIPNNGRPLMFRKITAGSHDRRLHSIAARARPGSGHVDILITDVLPTGAGYHYRTSAKGQLIKAMYADTQIRRIPDAVERFDTEIKNWREYLENVSHEQNGDQIDIKRSGLMRLTADIQKGRDASLVRLQSAENRSGAY